MKGISIMDKKTIRALSRAADEKAARYKYERDNEGSIIINMKVDDDSDFLSVFSSSKTPVISSEVADFIEHNTCSAPSGERFVLRIYSNCIDDEEKEIYRSAIKEYYTERYLASKKELRRNRLIALMLTFAGIVTLSLAFMTDNVIWSEVIDIGAWVFLWEAVDVSFFRNRSLRHDKMRCLSRMIMKVEYYDPETWGE